LGWVVLVVGVSAFVVFAANREEPSLQASQAVDASPATPIPIIPRLETPGIDRVGPARAAQLWANVPTTPGMQRWTCDDGLCQVMFNPSVWAQMSYDLKQNFTAAMGIAFAHGKQAEWTEIMDMMTGKELAQYTTRSDRVKIE